MSSQENEKSTSCWSSNVRLLLGVEERPGERVDLLAGQHGACPRRGGAGRSRGSAAESHRRAGGPIPAESHRIWIQGSMPSSAGLVMRRSSLSFLVGSTEVPGQGPGTSRAPRRSLCPAWSELVTPRWAGAGMPRRVDGGVVGLAVVGGGDEDVTRWPVVTAVVSAARRPSPTPCDRSTGVLESATTAERCPGGVGCRAGQSRA